MQLLGTVPLLSTMTIYAILLCTLKQKNTFNEATNRRMEPLEKMTHGIIFALVVLNVPGALFYFLTNKGGMTSIKEGNGDNFDTDVQV